MSAGESPREGETPAAADFETHLPRTQARDCRIPLRFDPASGEPGFDDLAVRFSNRRIPGMKPWRNGSAVGVLNAFRHQRMNHSWHSTYHPYSSSFFVRNAAELQAVIQEAADWIESQQASLQESNDFKAQTILQKAA